MTSIKIAAALRELRDEYLQPHDRPWIVAYSAGKDSTLLAQLVHEMLLDLPRSERKRRVHVVSNDTLVENPLMVDHMRTSLSKIDDAAYTLDLPIKTHITVPDELQTFWCNLIGRGYMPPNRRFRWCTDRMKILPTSAFIRQHVSAAGEVILLIGVRKSESANRAKTIEAHTVEGQRLNPHDDHKGCMVFRPIVDFTTDEVWQTLLQRRCPWGGVHRNLITLYKNAGAGECPLVIDRSAAPSCGGSRFGCWTCTVVSKDKSAQAQADSGIEDMEPLIEFRDWIKALQFDRSKRQITRRDGGLTVVDDQILPGPFSLTARQEILDRLLDTQARVGRQLITEDEINKIRRIWCDDILFLVKPQKPTGPTRWKVTK